METKAVLRHNIAKQIGGKRNYFHYKMIVVDVYAIVLTKNIAQFFATFCSDKKHTHTPNHTKKYTHNKNSNKKNAPKNIKKLKKCAKKIE